MILFSELKSQKKFGLVLVTTVGCNGRFVGPLDVCRARSSLDWLALLNCVDFN